MILNKSVIFGDWRYIFMGRFELLDKGQLVYRKRVDELPTVMEDDLRICLVRPMAECDRRFCFELISPNK